MEQGEVVATMNVRGKAIDRQQHRLPQRWLHLDRIVRAVSGEVFGEVALAHIDPGMANYPLAVPEYVWQQYGDKYLSSVLNVLMRWGDGAVPSRATLITFDDWLRVPGVGPRR